MINNEKLGAFIIPTGIGASIGGYAGDASFWARQFAQKCKLIINPNVVNAACFSGITENMLYVEGYSLDEFFKGNISLKQSQNNKIGIIFDKAIPQEVLNIHVNTINAVKTVYGIDVLDFVLTEEEVGVEFFLDKNGFSTGNVKNLATIKVATQKLIEQGAEAIAIVCHFPEDDNSEYQNGIGADPVGGVEAIISHYISKLFKIPCAHAPAFSNFSITTELVNPKCAAEYITPTFLPCILLGLAQAPNIKNFSKNLITIDNLDFIIVPHNCLGGIPVMKAIEKEITVYAVKENSTILNVNNSNFSQKCVIINTYKELLELI